MVNISRTHYLSLIFTVAMMAVSMIVIAVKNDFGALNYFLPISILVLTVFSAMFALVPDEENQL